LLVLKRSNIEFYLYQRHEIGYVVTAMAKNDSHFMLTTELRLSITNSQSVKYFHIKHHENTGMHGRLTFEILHVIQVIQGGPKSGPQTHDHNFVKS